MVFGSKKFPVDCDLLVPDPKSPSTSQFLEAAKPTNCGLTNLSQ